MNTKKSNAQTCRPMSVDDAAFALADARCDRAMVEASKGADPEWAATMLARADRLEDGAHTALEPSEPLRVGRGGEFIERDELGSVQSPPTLLHAEASRERLALLGNKTALALDVADAIGAQNSLECMLAHQMAKSHELAMRLSNQAMRFATKAEHFDSMGDHPAMMAANAEASRSANTAAKLMTAFQGAVLTLDGLRNGRRQTILVQHQHVTVQDGGRAVVATSIAGNGRGVLK